MSHPASESTFTHPPWRLYGHGFAVLFRLPSGSPSHPSCHGKKVLRPSGGIGVMLLLDYLRSSVGPYRECMIIPTATRATVRPTATKPGDACRRIVRLSGHTIARIVVTSEESMRGGRENWAIPKELGRIDWSSGVHDETIISVTDSDGTRLLTAELRPRRILPELPFTSRLLPHTLIQESDDHLVRTRMQSRGWVRPAQVVNLNAPGETFHVLRAVQRLLAIRIDRAELLFPAGDRFPAG